MIQPLLLPAAPDARRTSCGAQIKRSMQLPKLSAPPADFLTSMEAYVAEAPRPVAAVGEAPLPAKVGGGVGGWVGGWVGGPVTDGLVLGQGMRRGAIPASVTL